MAVMPVNVECDSANQARTVRHAGAQRAGRVLEGVRAKVVNEPVATNRMSARSSPRV